VAPINAISIQVDGSVQKVFKDGLYHGEIAKVRGSYRWRNLLADRIKSPFTQGEATNEALAFLMLGFRKSDDEQLQDNPG